jgi:hypothetical protein
MGILNFVPDVQALTNAFDQADGPTFFLFATAAFIDRMHTRLGFINAEIARYDKDDADKPRLLRCRYRARLLRQGVHYSVYGAILSAVLLAEIFATLILGFRYAYGAALMFLLAIICLGAGLLRFVQETRLAVREED